MSALTKITILIRIHFNDIYDEFMINLFHLMALKKSLLKRSAIVKEEIFHSLKSMQLLIFIDLYIP